jgi:hypothetical protein
VTCHEHPASTPGAGMDVLGVSRVRLTMAVDIREPAE